MARSRDTHPPGQLKRSTLKAGALTMLALQAQLSPAAVYRCTSPDNTVLFVQFRCPPASVEERVDPQHTSIVQIPALSPQEQQAVAALEQSLMATRREGIARRKQRRRTHAAQAAEASRQCRSAELALKEVQASRRQGYNAREARSLDAAERRWDRVRKENC